MTPGKLVIVVRPGAKTKDVIKDVLEGLARDVVYTRDERQQFMRESGYRECVIFHLKITAVRGQKRKYKKAKKA